MCVHSKVLNTSGTVRCLAILSIGARHPLEYWYGMSEAMDQDGMGYLPSQVLDMISWIDDC